MKLKQVHYRTNSPTDPQFKTEHVEVVFEPDSVDEDAQLLLTRAKQEAKKFLGHDITEEDVENAREVLTKAKRLGMSRSRKDSRTDDF